MVKYKVYYKVNSRFVKHYFDSFGTASGQALALAGQGLSVRIGATIDNNYSGTMYQYENKVRHTVNTSFIKEILKRLNQGEVNAR